jgi:hypothetical protein
VGGICHFLLPKRGSAARLSEAPAGLYAQEVMGLFANALRSTGTQPSDYIVKVFGGGNMFPDQMLEPACLMQLCADAHRDKVSQHRLPECKRGAQAPDRGWLLHPFTGRWWRW